MCLAIPAQIISLLDNQKALVNLGGITKQISLALLNNVVHPGDYVIVHVGYALIQLNEAEAEKTLQIFSQIQQMVDDNEIY